MTFLFTDIEGSTALMARAGEVVYAQVLAEHHALIRSALATHDGSELTMMGDGFFAAFTSSRECVAAVLAMQQALETHGWPAGEHVRVRMGVHTGEAEKTVAGPVGLDVHRAARIAAIAHGGQVLLSETAMALVRDWLPDAAVLTDLGTHRLRGLERPERLFQLTALGLQAEFPPVRLTALAVAGSSGRTWPASHAAGSTVRQGSCTGRRIDHSRLTRQCQHAAA